MCNVIIPFKLKQNSHNYVNKSYKLPNTTRAREEVGMDGFTSKKEP